MQEGFPEQASTSSERLSFDEARDRYQNLIFAFVSRRIRPIEEAQDLTAQVFVDAYRRWRHVRGPAKFYLLSIARNKVKDAIHKRRPQFSLNESELGASGMEDFVSIAEANEAIAIVMRLPEDERDAILLQVLEELTACEIASVLGRTTKATNSLLQRARARIQKMLGAQSTSEVQL